MSKAKVITYDLRASGRNYDKLYEALRNFPDWAKITESCWIVTSSNATSIIFDSLQKHMNANDRLFAAELNASATWKNVIGDDQAVKRILNNI